jgi:hypothetical protein
MSRNLGKASTYSRIIHLNEALIWTPVHRADGFNVAKLRKLASNLILVNWHSRVSESDQQSALQVVSWKIESSIKRSARYLMLFSINAAFSLFWTGKAIMDIDLWHR